MLNSWSGLLAWLPTQVGLESGLLLPEFSGQGPGVVGLKAMFRSWVGLQICSPTLTGYRMCLVVSWSFELVSLPCEAIEWVSWPVQTVGQGPKSGKTTNCVPWPGGAISSALQIDRAIRWDLCFGAAISKNLVCQDLSTGFCKPHPLSPSLSNAQWLSPTYFLS